MEGNKGREGIKRYWVFSVGCIIIIFWYLYVIDNEIEFKVIKVVIEVYS